MIDLCMENSVDKPQQAEDENKLIAERRAKLAALREYGPAFPMTFGARHLRQICSVITRIMTRRLEGMNASLLPALDS